MLDDEKNQRVNLTSSNTEPANTTFKSSVISQQQAKQDEAERMKNVNSGYIFLNVIAIALGFMQFGIGMNSFSNS